MKKCIPEWERRRGLGWFWKMERSGVVGEKDVAMALTLSLVLLFFFFVDNNNNNSNVYVYVRSCHNRTVSQCSSVHTTKLAHNFIVLMLRYVRGELLFWYPCLLIFILVLSFILLLGRVPLKFLI